MVSLAVTSIIILGSTLFWTILYKSLKKLHEDKPIEWHCRMVTLLHAILICCLTGYSVFIEGPWPFSDPGGPSTVIQHVSCSIVISYFLFDLIWMLLNTPNAWFMMLHHLLSIIGNVVVVYRCTQGTEMVATILGSEITNPLLQLRYFFKQTKMDKSILAEVNNLLFILTFGGIRIGMGSYLLYCYYLHPAPDIFGRIGGTTMYSISWIFWIQICLFSWNKYSKMWKNYQKSGFVFYKSQPNGYVQNGHNGVKKSN